MHHFKIFFFAICTILFLSSDISAQKNLYLENTKTGKSHLIKTCKKIKLIVKGYDKTVKATLIAVSDSGITLKGKFITDHVTKKEEHSVNLNDVYSIRRISTPHIISRVASGIVIFNIGVGALSFIDDLNNDPEAKGDGGILILIGAAAAAAALPFYIHARYLPLNDQWKLTVK